MQLLGIASMFDCRAEGWDVDESSSESFGPLSGAAESDWRVTLRACLYKDLLGTERKVRQYPSTRRRKLVSSLILTRWIFGKRNGLSLNRWRCN